MIYLDHAAATPLDSRVKNAMEPFLADQFFNPSSPYLPAKKVKEAYEDAKNRIAHTIGAKGNDIVITAGATEANNLAFNLDYEGIAIRNTNLKKYPRIAVLATEHDSVRGLSPDVCDVDFIKVDNNGRIVLKDLERKIHSETVLVSVALANNETGVVQPLSEIAAIIKNTREKRLKRGSNVPIFLHSDASQALSLIDISVARLGVDMMTINSAKICGPKGVGALYVSHDVLSFLKPIVSGGGQENGLRAGTENVPGVIGFAKAAELAKNHAATNRRKYTDYCEMFREILRDCKVKPIFLSGRKKLANFCSVSFPGIDAERIIYMLEDQEIYLSTGAACAASKGQKSRTLQAMGLKDDEIAGSLRISFGPTNDAQQIRTAARKIVEAVESEYNRIHGE
ncbi:MAG: cysteine desulfurase family protein [Candidatus Saccharibacteria bacterium]|nr:cysteine desulfurase family protein [Candidatus Saccharibacteria bacterium]